MKIQELNPKDVIVNPAISARKGEPKKEKIAELCESFVTRRESGQIHQIQPGVVRSKDNKFECVVGRHRLYACIECNATLGKDEEPFLFHAVVVRDNDEQALVTAITENRVRNAETLFDRAESMQKLLDLGKSQDQIAAIYGLDKSTVSNTLAAGKLPQKLQKMVLDGDFEPDAALLIAQVADTTVRQEMIEECIRHRDFFDDYERKLAAEKESDGKGKKGKKAEPEAESEAETEDEDDEKAPAKAKKAAKKKATKSKVTKEDVSRVARSTPAAAKSAAAAPSARLSDKKFFAILEALYKDTDKPLPKSAKAVISAVEALKDGEIGVEAFRNRLLKNCTAE